MNRIAKEVEDRRNNVHRQKGGEEIAEKGIESTEDKNNKGIVRDKNQNRDTAAILGSLAGFVEKVQGLSGEVRRNNFSMEQEKCKIDDGKRNLMGGQNERDVG